MQFSDAGITGGRWDTAAARPFAKLAEGWRNLTGLSHFVLCRIVWSASNVLGLAYLAMRGFSVWNLLVMTLGLIFFGYIMVRVVPAFEKHSESLSDTVPVQVASWAISARWLRWMGLFWVGIDLFQTRTPWVLSEDITFVATFFLLTVVGQPPAKALWKRAIEALRPAAVRLAYAA